MRAQHLFSTREGGASSPPYAGLNLGDHVGDDPAAVRGNRAELARTAGLDPARVVFMEQVHGAGVTVVDGPRPGAVARSDALVTTTALLGLVVLAADCVPLLLAEEQAGVVAAVHAGRRGVQGGVALRALEVMVELGAEPGRIAAYAGPAICGRCYEVPAAMQREVLLSAPAAAAVTRAGTPALDLRAGLAGQLRTAGVTEVTLSDVCTAEDPAYFSYRRDGVTGRSAGLVWLAP